MRRIDAVRGRWRATRARVAGTRSSSAEPGRRQRGAAAVEFALIAPILFVLVFGIIDFGLYINANAVVTNATREGARAASLGANTSEIDSVTRSALSELPASASAVVVLSCKTPAGSVCSSYASGADAGGTAIVEVQYQHPWLTPLLPSSGITIDITSEMRIE